MEWVSIVSIALAAAALVFSIRLKKKLEKANRRIRNLIVRVEAIEKYSGIAQTNTDIRVK